MKYPYLIMGVVSISILYFSGFASANVPYMCGSNRITGQLTTPDVTTTSVQVTLFKEGVAGETLTTEIAADGSYVAYFDPTKIEDAVYTVKSIAIWSGQEDTWEYDIYIGKDCGICGNGYIDANEQCESNDDCSEGLFCGGCACLEWRQMRDLIHTYADEVAEYKANEAEQVLPSRFIATGGPFAFVDSLIKKLGIRFASSKSAVYTTVPEWTLDPTVDGKDISLESVYASLPRVYQNKQAYLRFKGLFVPIEMAGKFATPDQVLERLNEGAVIAPETPSINTIGAVKMVYAHALSYTASPFAGIGSYISVFGAVGDNFQVYVKKDQRTYEQRTYVIKSKFQIAPEKTEILQNFKKEGADSIAIITCRDGDVLGSTKAREIVLGERLKDEMGEFQKTMIALGDEKQLALAKKKIDAYLADKNLSEEQVVQLVTKLEQVADKGKGNPLAVIATYGKYMAAYDAVYNDDAL